MKNEDEKERRSHRYDINGLRTRHGHRYSKYKNCLSMLMVICVEQHLKLNSWQSKAALRLSWKKALLTKKSVY